MSALPRPVACGAHRMATLARRYNTRTAMVRAHAGILHNRTMRKVSKPLYNIDLILHVVYNIICVITKVQHIIALKHTVVRSVIVF